MTENRLRDMCLWFMVVLQLGIRTSKALLLIPPPMRNMYMAISDTSREATARIQFFQELAIPSTPILILADSNTALDIANDDAVNHRKAKHIDIKYHTIRHYIQEDKVVVNHIPGTENIADLFTKPLGPQKHQQFVDYMGMRNFHEIMD
jgi:hypothetical protein